MTDQSEVGHDLSNGAVFNDLERPLTTDFKVTPLFDAEYLRNGTRYRHSYKWNTNRDLHTCPTQGFISNDLE